MPHRGNIFIQLDHGCMVGKTFKHCGKTHDAAAGERLEEFRHRSAESVQPVADLRNQPGLAAWVTKRAALGNLGYICRCKERLPTMGC